MEGNALNVFSIEDNVNNNTNENELKKKLVEMEKKLEVEIKCRQECESAYKTLQVELKDEKMAKTKVLKEHKDLISKLRERIECPVCLEVPELGPVASCPNGHLVCSKCAGDNCPTCRSKMFNRKSCWI